MLRPDAPDTPDTLDQHPLGRVVATRSEVGAAMCTELALDGTRSELEPSTLTTIIRLVITTDNHACNAATNFYDYRHFDETIYRSTNALMV